MWGLSSQSETVLRQPPRPSGRGNNTNQKTRVFSEVDLMTRFTIAATIAATSAFVIACCPAQAVPISSFQNGDWEVATTWGSGSGPVPGLSDTATINHAVTMDKTDGLDGVDDTAGDVIINAGGTLGSWMGDMVVDDLTFNGGEAGANQRTLDFNATSIIVNNVAGNAMFQTKKGGGRNLNINAATMSGAGDLTINSGDPDQYTTFDVDDMTGFTGTIIMSRLGVAYNPGDFLYRFASNTETNAAYIKVAQSIDEEDASFSVVLTSYNYDWTEANGGTPATDDGTAYNGYDMRDANVTLWVTELTIGGFSVPAREGSAYTYAELAAMNGGDVANYLRSDGTDGLIGVTVVPEPSTMLLTMLGGLGLAFIRRRQHD
jgi:hypothetical protein